MERMESSELLSCLQASSIRVLLRKSSGAEPMISWNFLRKWVVLKWHNSARASMVTGVM
ncbi:hypothetical protein D3C73_1438950 [compost metagenome]